MLRCDPVNNSYSTNHHHRLHHLSASSNAVFIIVTQRSQLIAFSVAVLLAWCSGWNCCVCEHRLKSTCQLQDVEFCYRFFFRSHELRLTFAQFLHLMRARPLISESTVSQAHIHIIRTHFAFPLCWFFFLYPPKQYLSGRKRWYIACCVLLMLALLDLCSLFVSVR